MALQIDTLCTMRTDEAIRQALDDLPKDLPDTFSRILRRSSGVSDKHYQRRIFELVIAACRPLTIDELREALSVTPGDTVWDPARFLNDVYSTLACCGSLIIVDEEFLTVKLIHHSVKQFLLGGLRSSTAETFTVISAHKTMIEIILTYLNYGVFDTQLSTTVVPQLMARAVPSTIISSTSGHTKVKELALEFLKSPSQPRITIDRTLANKGGSRSKPYTSQFHFFPYAKLYWLQHSSYAWEQVSTAQKLLQQLLESDTIDINLRDETGQTPLQWAIRQRHEAVVRLLLEKGANFEAKDHYGDSQIPLMWAAREGHEAVVRLLLEKGADIEGFEAPDEIADGLKLDEDARTPLGQAAQNGHETVVRLLLEKGACIEGKAGNGAPLSRAAQEGHEAIVRLLLEKGAFIEAEDGAPLFWAVKHGHEAVVRLLLEKGASIKVDGGAPLFWAVQLGREAIVRLLLEKGSYIEAKASAPLLWAVQLGHEAIVRLLLEKGASVEAEDGAPLSWAVKHGHEAIVRLLLEKGANAEANYKGTHTPPLVRAIDQGNEAIVRLLVENGANIEAKDNDGYTPLVRAAKVGGVAVMQLLLEKGANTEAKDSDGYTPLEWAAKQGHKAVVRLLLEKGANIEEDDCDYSSTPLLWAVQQGHEAVVRLLEKSAKTEAKDSNGSTPLLLAVRRGHEALVRLLSENGARAES